MQVPELTIDMDCPLLVFGGPYGNLQATEALLEEARRLRIPKERVVCTGDIIAYCGDPVATIDLVRLSGIHVVMGNCDEQLASGADNCGCGFPSDSLCERLSSAWFTQANRVVRPDQRAWLAGFPRRIDLKIAGLRLAVIHGSVSVVNRFVFATTPAALKRDEIELAGCDGVIGGHCGLPFTEFVDGLLWHNAGVIGMPANDGTQRVWFSLLRSGGSGVSIEHRALDYDHAGAALAMRTAGLPREYRVSLATGIWPSCDVLPLREAAEQGVPLQPETVEWPTPSRGLRDGSDHSETKLCWPACIAEVVDATSTAEEPAAGAHTLAPVACCSPGNAAAVRDLYRNAALTPDAGLVCATNPVWQLPGLAVPRGMVEMNYGCGSTVHPGDLARSPNVLYVGVGGGLEVLQFAYFSRRRGAVIGLDVVDEMLATCRRNLEEAEELNAWFERSFVDLRKGDALDLPVEDDSIEVAAQNCLFNIFHDADQQRALAEISRVLKPGGRLILSDPICETGIPDPLRSDERLRAMCLTGAIPLKDYVMRLGQAGFGRVEIRARRPYRVLGPTRYATEKPILLESVEISAIKSPVGADGPTVYAGQAAIYYGDDPAGAEVAGIRLPANQPVPVSVNDSDKLKAIGRTDIFLSEPTWSHAGETACC